MTVGGVIDENTASQPYRTDVAFKQQTAAERQKMSFTIYQADGTTVIQWFFNIDELIKSMLNNPNDRYWRN